MYDKNLCEFLNLRLSSKDMDFLRDLSSKRSVTISECIRVIISDYRRSFESLNISITEKGANSSYGNTKTNINNKL